MVYRPCGIVDEAQVEEIDTALDQMEAATNEQFQRYTDLSKADAVVITVGLGPRLGSDTRFIAVDVRLRTRRARNLFAARGDGAA